MKTTCRFTGWKLVSLSPNNMPFLKKWHVFFTKRQLQSTLYDMSFFDISFFNVLAVTLSQKHMSFLPKNGENDMSYDIVFYLRMTLFWPCFRPVCPFYWPVSKIIIRTPKLMISNSKMLEIPLLKHQNWPKNSKSRVKIQSSWT